jgi:hypothetical protein
VTPEPTDELIDDPSIYSGRFVGLRPVTTGDYDFLFVLFNHPGQVLRTRLAGLSLAPEDFPKFLWDGVLCQYLITRLDTRQPAGLVTAYNADVRNGHVALAAYTDPQYNGKGWPLEGVLLAIRLLFRNHPFNKIYMEAPEYTFSQFGSGSDRLFEQEGVLKDHFFLRNKRWDMHILAVYRDTAERELPRLLP